MKSALSTLKDIKAISLKIYSEASGKLAAIENYAEVPWGMQRVFIITAENLEIRGNHAHKNCSQAFVVISGKVLLKSFDGLSEESFELNPLDKLLLVPPHIWLDLELSAGSALMVLTDEPYDEEDYIREKKEFLKFRMNA